MVLIERKEIGSRDVSVDGTISVREDSVIERDGIEIARTYHRHVLAPGDSITDQDPAVQRIAMAEHTPSVIASYRAARDINT